VVLGPWSLALGDHVSLCRRWKSKLRKKKSKKNRGGRKSPKTLYFGGGGTSSGRQARGKATVGRTVAVRRPQRAEVVVGGCNIKGGSQTTKQNGKRKRDESGGNKTGRHWEIKSNAPTEGKQTDPSGLSKQRKKAEIFGGKENTTNGKRKESDSNVTRKSKEKKVQKSRFQPRKRPTFP